MMFNATVLATALMAMTVNAAILNGGADNNAADIRGLKEKNVGAHKGKKSKKGKKDKRSVKDKKGGKRQKPIYTAAVAEVGRRPHVTTVIEALENAAASGAQIISFPEVGPEFCQDALCTKSSYIITLPRPDPYTDISGSCADNTDVSFASFNCLAKLAKQYKMYISINVGDKQPCILDSTTVMAPYNVTNLCQRVFPEKDEVKLVYVFNTMAIFSPQGALVAKYYKHALFSASGNYFKPGHYGLAQTTPELSKYFDAEGIFETNFGIKFATMICNDINDGSLLAGIKKKGITDIIYGNSYENIMTAETIGSTLNAVSYFYGFNIVAASVGFKGAGGSGVYSNGQVLTNLSDNTQLNCTLNLPYVPPIDSKSNCISVRVADVNKRTIVKSTTSKDSSSSVSTSTNTWNSDSSDYSIALPAPGAWFNPEAVNVMGPHFNFTFGHGFTFNSSTAEYGFFDAINQVAKTSIFTPPTQPGVYEAHVLFKEHNNELKCSAILDFAEGTPEGTGKTQYALVAYSGDSIFPSTACPDSVSFCALSRCLKFDDKTGACITVQGIGGAPAPLKSEIAHSITVSATFADSTFPLASVSDSNLQPVDMSDLTLSGSFKYEDFRMNEEGVFVTDNFVYAIETNGDNAFVTLNGMKKFSVPEQCNACSNAYDLFNFTNARVTDERVRPFICSGYKEF